MKNPTKDKIIQLLSERTKPLKLIQLSKIMGIPAQSAEYTILKDLLTALCNEGIITKIYKRSYIISDKSTSNVNPIIGILKIKNERGTIYNDKTHQKYSIRRRDLLTGLDGDTVEIKTLAEKFINDGFPNKLRAEIIRIIKRPDRKIVGIIEFDGSFYYLIPDDPCYYVDFLIQPDKLNGAKNGDKVSAKFIQWVDHQKSPEAEVINKIGSARIPTVEYASILEEFNLSETFPETVINEAKSIKKAIGKTDIDGRIDLRKEIVITIDPDDAKDFDDALSVSINEKGNYNLGVHIADVSYYIKTDSFLDIEAFRRSNSTYLVDRVVPMLPEELSNEICSLKPNRIRMTFSVFIEFSPTGKIIDYKISESVIRSKKRYTYDEVLKIVEDSGEKSAGKAKDKDSEILSAKDGIPDKILKDTILNLFNLSVILRNKRLKEGGINFETQELKFKLDENGIPIKAILKRTTKSTSLVEECMLSANKVIAEHITRLSKKYNLKVKLPFLYRVHDIPDHDKLRSILEFIMLMGHKGDARSGKAVDINALLAQFESRTEKPIVHQMLVRAMPKAEYSIDNIGHFGLGYKFYTHFTSPIRRYSDLIVHRLIKLYNHNKPADVVLSRLTDFLIPASEQCTIQERNSMDAERASVKLTQCVLAQKFIGEEFYGTISGISSFGIFVIMDDIFAEGLIHIRDLADDYYVFDEAGFKLVGRRFRKIYRFGDRIKVKITKVNIDKRRIDLQAVR